MPTSSQPMRAARLRGRHHATASAASERRRFRSRRSGGAILAPRVAQLSVGKDFTVFVVGGGVAYGCGNGEQGQLGPLPRRRRRRRNSRAEDARVEVRGGGDYSLGLSAMTERWSV